MTVALCLSGCLTACDAPSAPIPPEASWTVRVPGWRGIGVGTWTHPQSRCQFLVFSGQQGIFVLPAPGEGGKQYCGEMQ